jgi:hypothetical protein
MGTEGVITEDLISKGGHYEHDGCNLIFLSQKKVLYSLPFLGQLKIQGPLICLST